MVKHPASPAVERQRAPAGGPLSVVKSDKKAGGASGKEALGSSSSAYSELADSDLVLPPVLPFKRSHGERPSKGPARGKHWKHLKQILQGENYHLYSASEPNYVNIEAPPSAYPAKKYCDISGLEAVYTDPRTKIRYANAEMFKKIRFFPEQQVQGYLALRNASVVLK